MKMIQVDEQELQQLREAVVAWKEHQRKTDEEKRTADEKEKYDKIKKDILSTISPISGKKVKFVNDFPEADKAEPDTEYRNFGDFLEMVRLNHPDIQSMRNSRLNDTKYKTAMSTTNAQGGYTIPEEWVKEILNELNNNADIMPLFFPVPLAGDTLHLNSLNTDLTVAWSTEAATKTATKPTFSQADLTLRFLYAIITRTIELAQDSIINIPGLLNKLVAKNMALEIEQEGLEGAGAPFTGLLNAVGVNAQAMAAANLQYADLTAARNNTGVLNVYKKAAKWMMTEGALDIVMNLVDLNNRPLINFEQLKADVPLTLFGKKILISDQIADTTGAAGTTTIYFGDPGNIWMGKKKGHETMSVLYSQDAVVGSENFFTDNKDGWRFELRRGIIVAIPAAFVRLTGVK